MESLLGDNPSPEMLDRVSFARHVTKNTSPSFLYSTTADQTVNSMNATAYYDALKRAGVPAELHIYAQGGHGYGLRRTALPVTAWPVAAAAWLRGLDVIRGD